MGKVNSSDVVRKQGFFSFSRWWIQWTFPGTSRSQITFICQPDHVDVRLINSEFRNSLEKQKFEAIFIKETKLQLMNFDIINRILQMRNVVELTNKRITQLLASPWYVYSSDVIRLKTNRLYETFHCFGNEQCNFDSLFRSFR